MDPRIPKAVAGDGDALFELLYEQHDRLKVRLLRKMTSVAAARLDADEILQEALADCFSCITRFEPKSDRAFEHWLNRMVETTLLDAIRKV